ncbi:hypothetical protein D3C76_812860 [compost metagenome]
MPKVPEPVRSPAIDRVWKPLAPKFTVALSSFRSLRLESPFICQRALRRSRSRVPLAGSASRVSPRRSLPWLTSVSRPLPATWASTSLSRLEPVSVESTCAPSRMS